MINFNKLGYTAFFLYRKNALQQKPSGFIF